MKVLFTINYGKEKFDKIRELGYDVIHYSEDSIENNEDVNTADVLVTYNPFERLDISKMKNLQYIQTTSVGIDQLPKEEVLKRNIKIANNRGGYSVPIGESIVLYILEIYKNSAKFFKQQQNKEWKMDFSVSELYGQRVGFLGTGAISSEAAKRLKAFGLEIWGVNTDGSSKKYFDKCFATEDMNIVFEECDIVVVAMPSTKSTDGIVNKDMFKLMKDGSLFINVGRGNTVNQKDLEECVEKFRGVALDVFESEPLNKDNKLWECENVIVTPHNSWVSDKNKERTFNMVYNNLKHYIMENKPVDNVVDISRGY
ncbi:phosphoglycerate dehydrogenase [Clostridioides difficile]|uniref:phosphoglycerate dehydrogenase n=1 Tax=Clostridioides difficile TaxID=1496 RepID=UPI0005DDBAD0|nr:phosphoglycerate dehydrogenase [Clostridioides difficile]KJF63299.1 dihydrofolate reductase [Clostridioides difficile]MCK3748215.1 phosphoglycerate dehydrogenase [Clostridioides difficile]MCP8397467.1 phosphoglycerate dehydrogenase [Clostridioides difficile]MCP8414412.1 phosphoglycerate dehydrogenase [Clostridioides difficile]MCP8493544.1 phosphoglycerate dehydrogenase [Clostridioides difficile]